MGGTEESGGMEGYLLQLGTPLPTLLPTQPLPTQPLPTQPLPTLLHMLLPTPLPQRESFCFFLDSTNNSFTLISTLSQCRFIKEYLSEFLRIESNNVN